MRQVNVMGSVAEVKHKCIYLSSLYSLTKVLSVGSNLLQ